MRKEILLGFVLIMGLSILGGCIHKGIGKLWRKEGCQRDKNM